ncbi:MAG: hypothetical protein LAT53_02245 [Idiomarina sp.]|nr:hypothetical protein [Idiomarina sp.]
MAVLKKLFSALSRSAVTLIVTLIGLAFISTGYTVIAEGKERLAQYAELEMLYEDYMEDFDEALADLEVRRVTLNDTYYIHDEGTANEHYSFTFLFADDNPRMSGRTVYSFEMPESFNYVPIISLASDARIYALDPTAQYEYEEEKAHGIPFFIFICLMVLFPYLAFVSWLWRGHNKKQ